MAERIAQLGLEFHEELAVVVGFDAPDISSDGGAVLLRQVDDRLGLSAWMARLLPDARNALQVAHDRLEQVRQRLYQIALGYEDCNDAQSLRHDPVLKTACERTPDDEQGLSSQPTLSRFENAVGMRTVKQVMEGLEHSWVEGLAPGTAEVVLDIDTTDDETHGQQQLSFFHGYYDHHMYHPLLIFDGEGQLVSAILRPGNVHAARRALSVLQRVIRKLKQRFPDVQVVVRGDAGFSVPRLLDGLEHLNAELGGIDYLFGIAKNAVLLRLAAPAMAESAACYARTHGHVREFTKVAYAAESWSRKRTVVVKAEHHPKGANPRFVVTTLGEFEAQLIYDAYCERGQCENLIKDLKNALKADRLSCSTFVVNAFRLLLHAAAYRLMHALRHAAQAIGSDLGRQQFDTIRLRLLKVAALVAQSTRRICIRLPRAFPLAGVFRALALHTARVVPRTA